MRYMLLIYGDEAAFADMDPGQVSETMQEYEKYSAWLVEKGWMRAGDPLADTDKATTVRLSDGQTLTVDGPFADTWGRDRRSMRTVPFVRWIGVRVRLQTLVQREERTDGAGERAPVLGI
jgi:hypothetical protein